MDRYGVFDGLWTSVVLTSKVPRRVDADREPVFFFRPCTARVSELPVVARSGSRTGEERTRLTQ